MDFFTMIVVVTALSTGGGVMNAWIKHRSKLAEMRLQAPARVDVNLRAELDALRQELRQLRETSTQYDLSLDTALQRMESRMEGMERRVGQVEANVINQLGSGR